MKKYETKYYVIAFIAGLIVGLLEAYEIYLSIFIYLY